MYGRDPGGRPTTFGTTGYTVNNVFVLYDRATESIWYPLEDGEFNAISGSRKGERIPFISKPTVQPLTKWLEQHPESKVLLEGRRFLDEMEKWAPRDSMRSPGHLSRPPSTGTQAAPVHPSS